MSEMIERVALALAKEMANKSAASSFEDPRYLSCVTVDDLFDMRDVARAAIEAMREPTEAMITAARATDLWDFSVPDSEPDHVHLEETRKELAAAFGMMIDEALK